MSIKADSGSQNPIAPLSHHPASRHHSDTPNCTEIRLPRGTELLISMRSCASMTTQRVRPDPEEPPGRTFCSRFTSGLSRPPAFYVRQPLTQDKPLRSYPDIRGRHPGQGQPIPGPAAWSPQPSQTAPDRAVLAGRPFFQKKSRRLTASGSSSHLCRPDHAVASAPRRRRIAPATAPNPKIISAQVAGSGTPPRARLSNSNEFCDDWKVAPTICGPPLAR